MAASSACAMLSHPKRAVPLLIGDPTALAKVPSG